MRKTTRNKKIPVINSPLQLANQSVIQYGMIPGSLTYSYFQNSNETELHKMWLHMTKTNPGLLEWSARRGITRVRESGGTYAFFLESVFAKYLASQKPCNLELLDEYINTSYYALAVKKRSPLLERLNAVLTTLVKNHTVEKLQTKWWKGKCNRRPYGSGAKKRDKQSDGPTIDQRGASKNHIANITNRPSLNKQTIKHSVNERIGRSSSTYQRLPSIEMTVSLLFLFIL